MSKEAAPNFSVVTTLFHSSAHIEEFYNRAVKTLEQIEPNFEIIMVNDGSPDRSLNIALEIHKRDPRVVVIDLSKNFGQHKAILTGLAHTKGEYIFLFEIDLEEQPEWIKDFYDALIKEKDVDVVFGVQKRRKGFWFERNSGQLFYTLFNLFSDVKIPINHVTARIMTRRYAQALLKFKDRELFIGGIYELAGFRQIPMTVTKLSRSRTTYSFNRKLALLANAVTSFSTVPLSVISWAGVIMSVVSLALILWIISRWMFLSIAPGWTSILASIWFLGGMTLLSIGIIGMYIKKILGEVKDRPYTVVRGLYDSRN
jgi:putative glycosyltransferase